MSDMVPKMPKQWNTPLKCCGKSSEKTQPALILVYEGCYSNLEQVSNHRTTGIFGHSNVEGKLHKHSAIPRDCCRGTQYLVPKMTPVHCFLLVAVRKLIFGEVYLFSDTVVFTFSEAAFGGILASIRCPKTHQFTLYFCNGSCFEHSGAQVNTDHSDSINNRTLKFVISCLQTSWGLHSISINTIYRLWATCLYLSGVCTLSSSWDTAHYRSNSTIYTAHKSTSILYVYFSVR